MWAKKVFNSLITLYVIWYTLLPSWTEPATFPSIVNHPIKLSFGLDPRHYLPRADHMKTRFGRDLMLAKTIPFGQSCAIIWAKDPPSRLQANKRLRYLAKGESASVQNASTEKTTWTRFRWNSLWPKWWHRTEHIGYIYWWNPLHRRTERGKDRHSRPSGNEANQEARQL